MRKTTLTAFYVLCTWGATAQFGAQVLVDHTTTKLPHDVELGDIDGDGDVDILCASTGPDATLVWFPNRGDGTFFPRRPITILGGFDVMRLVDMDEDTDLDIVSTGEFPGEVYWYRNLGGGAFSEQLIISTQAPEGKEVDVADMDGDGDLDVLSASYGNGRIAWYASNGNGGFGAQQTIATITGAYTVHAADLDGDGDKDVLAGGQTTDGIFWYRNGGSGSFTAMPVLDPTLTSCDRAQTADINGDGALDIVVLSSVGGVVKWYANQGNGTFATGVSITGTIAGVCVRLADLDADGDIDAIVGDLDRMRYWTNDGTGAFTGPVTLANGFDAWAVATGDVTGDGVLDIVGTYFDNSLVMVNEGTGFGTYGPLRVVGTPADAIRSMATADFDGDGLLDVAEAVSNENKIAWFRNQGDGTFSIERSVTDDAWNVAMVHAADMDGDGDIDLVSAAAYELFGNRTAWYANDGSGNFGPLVDLGFCSTVFDALCADVEGDGDVDILAALPNPPCGMGWLINDGNGNFSSPSPPINTDGYLWRAFDVDEDGDQDLVSAVDEVQLLLNEGGVYTASQITIDYGTLIRCIQLVDLDEDADLDIAFTFGYSVIWLENNDGVFTGGGTILQSNDLYYFIQMDVDGDGLKDIVGCMREEGALYWAKNLGAGNYEYSELLPIVLGRLSVMRAVDMDADGDEDLLSGSTVTGKLAYWPSLSINTGLAPVQAHESGMRAAPNPFKHTLTLLFDAPIAAGTPIELIDPVGRSVRTWASDGTSRMDLPCGDLRPGAYLVRVMRPQQAVRWSRVVVE